MTSTTPTIPMVVPIDDEHARTGEHTRMMEDACSPEGKAAIGKAQAEVDAGRCIVADDAYFETLKARRAQWR